MNESSYNNLKIIKLARTKSRTWCGVGTCWESLEVKSLSVSSDFQLYLNGRTTSGIQYFSLNGETKKFTQWWNNLKGKLLHVKHLKCKRAINLVNLAFLHLAFVSLTVHVNPNLRFSLRIVGLCDSNRVAWFKEAVYMKSHWRYWKENLQELSLICYFSARYEVLNSNPHELQNLSLLHSGYIY